MLAQVNRTTIPSFSMPIYLTSKENWEEDRHYFKGINKNTNLKCFTNHVDYTANSSSRNILLLVYMQTVHWE